jgi:hypothetical protein
METLDDHRSPRDNARNNGRQEQRPPGTTASRGSRLRTGGGGQRGDAAVTVSRHDENS